MANLGFNLVILITFRFIYSHHMLIFKKTLLAYKNSSFRFTNHSLAVSHSCQTKSFDKSSFGTKRNKPENETLMRS